jgi:hypothetical protein
MNAIPLREAPESWFRGRARRSGSKIALDMTHAETYLMTPDRRLGIELARVRTPDQAVALVSRYGLLMDSPGVDSIRPPFGPKVREEPYELFEAHAEDLRRIIRTVLLVRDAACGDAEALGRLRQQVLTPRGEIRTTAAWQERHYASFRPEGNERDLVLRVAADSAIHALNMGMFLATVFAADPSSRIVTSEGRDPTPSDGEVEILLSGGTLLQACYMSVARSLASQAPPIRTCDECQRIFIVEDTRQRFCEPQCANRARFRRWSEKQPASRKKPFAIPGSASEHKQEKKRHGKTARAR